MAYQLDLFAAYQAAPVHSVPILVATNPASQPAKSYTIEHNPLKGFKVVLAPGLTNKTPKNPCLSCPENSSGNHGKDYCSEFCKLQTERDAYLKQIGIGLVSAADGGGAYGIGS